MYSIRVCPGLLHKYTLHVGNGNIVGLYPIFVTKVFHLSISSILLIGLLTSIPFNHLYFAFCIISILFCIVYYTQRAIDGEHIYIYRTLFVCTLPNTYLCLWFLNLDLLSSSLHNTIMYYTWEDSPSLGYNKTLVMRWWSTHIGGNHSSKIELKITEN